MTKKDYELIAEAVNTYFKAELNGDAYDLVTALSDILMIDNPRFDPIKFREACEKGL